MGPIPYASESCLKDEAVKTFKVEAGKLSKFKSCKSKIN